MALTDSMSSCLDDYGIHNLLSEEVKLQTWLDVEAALAQAQAEQGVIPQDAANKIKKAARLENLDLEKMKQIRQTVGHGFVPFTKVFVEACDEESGKYIHYGVTTQNIQQSSQNIILKKVNQCFLQMTKQVLRNLLTLAEDHADTVMAGRTHGRHAVPITFGYKVSCWIYEVMMNLERLEELEKRDFTIMMGGAVGAFNSTGRVGLAVQKRVGELLGMDTMMIPSRSISSPKIEYINALALLANTFHKIAEEVFQTSIEEFGELSEGFKKGTIGSSTMPHKINPKLSKGIIANSQKLYTLTEVGYFSSCRPYEADSSSYMLFDGLLLEAVGLMREIIIRAVELTANLQVYKEQLYKNVLKTDGLDNSEYIMMKLAEKVGKDHAHSIIYDLAIEKELTHKPYIDILLCHPLIRELFSEEEVQEMLKPENYTGLSSTLTKQMVCQARKTYLGE